MLQEPLVLHFWLTFDSRAEVRVAQASPKLHAPGVLFVDAWRESVVLR